MAETEQSERKLGMKEHREGWNLWEVSLESKAYCQTVKSFGDVEDNSKSFTETGERMIKSQLGR